jgi:hypothetical protein
MATVASRVVRLVFFGYLCLIGALLALYIAVGLTNHQ